MVLYFHTIGYCINVKKNILYVCVHAKSLQSCLTLCNPMNYSPPSSSVPGILQARILEWVAVPFSRGSSEPKSPGLQADFLLSEPPRKSCY